MIPSRALPVPRLGPFPPLSAARGLIARPGAPSLPGGLIVSASLLDVSPLPAYPARYRRRLPLHARRASRRSRPALRGGGAGKGEWRGTRGRPAPNQTSPLAGPYPVAFRRSLTHAFDRERLRAGGQHHESRHPDPFQSESALFLLVGFEEMEGLRRTTSAKQGPSSVRNRPRLVRAFLPGLTSTGEKGSVASQQIDNLQVGRPRSGAASSRPHPPGQLTFSGIFTVGRRT